MGLMDKMKTGAKNLDNRMGQSVDSAKYDSKIADQKNIKKKAIEEAGQKMFEAYVANGSTAITDEVKELYEKAKACDAEIEKLEKEKADMIEANKAERQSNRDELAAKEEADRKAKEEAKAAEEKKE